MEIWKFWKRISVDKIQCCGGCTPDITTHIFKLFNENGSWDWQENIYKLVTNFTHLRDESDRMSDAGGCLDGNKMSIDGVAKPTRLDKLPEFISMWLAMPSTQDMNIVFLKLVDTWTAEDQSYEIAWSISQNTGALEKLLSVLETSKKQGDVQLHGCNVVANICKLPLAAKAVVEAGGLAVMAGVIENPANNFAVKVSAFLAIQGMCVQHDEAKFLAKAEHIDNQAISYMQHADPTLAEVANVVRYILETDVVSEARNMMVI